MEISPRHETAGVGQMSWNVSEMLSSSTANTSEIPRHHPLLIGNVDYPLGGAMKYATVAHEHVCKGSCTHSGRARKTSNPRSRYGTAADGVRRFRDPCVRR